MLGIKKELKFLQPAQYESWLRKVDDPEWYEHRYRDAEDNAMANAIRELRRAFDQLAIATARGNYWYNRVSGKQLADVPADVPTQEFCGDVWVSDPEMVCRKLKGHSGVHAHGAFSWVTTKPDTVAEPVEVTEGDPQIDYSRTGTLALIRQLKAAREEVDKLHLLEIYQFQRAEKAEATVAELLKEPTWKEMKMLVKRTAEMQEAVSAVTAEKQAIREMLEARATGKEAEKDVHKTQP